MGGSNFWLFNKVLISVLSDVSSSLLHFIHLNITSGYDVFQAGFRTSCQASIITGPSPPPQTPAHLCFHQRVFPLITWHHLYIKPSLSRGTKLHLIRSCVSPDWNVFCCFLFIHLACKWLFPECEHLPPGSHINSYKRHLRPQKGIL